MTAAVLSIGTELTRGELVNTNAQWLAEQLTTLGFQVVEHATIDDDSSRIVSTLRRLVQDNRIVVCTGGLGPTSDDLTSAAVAEAMDVPLVRDAASLKRIQELFKKYGVPMPETNASQADFPEGAEVLSNAVGTAPGFAVKLDAARCFFMPGVPREMRHIFETHVRPAIESLAPRTTYQVHIRTFGMTESQVAQQLQSIEASAQDVVIGYRAHFPEIEVKVLARGRDFEAARERAEAVANEVRTQLGGVVFGDRDTRFAGWVGGLLRQRGLKLAVAESCTGGLVGSMLTEVAGSSEYFVFDAVTYANSAKTDVLGVPAKVLDAHGAVSAEVVQAMAEGVRNRASADVAVAVTGIAGPGGGTPEKPVGTVWFALAQRGQPTRTLQRVLPGDRERIRILSAYVALRLVAEAALAAASEDSPLATKI